jgi:predicted Rossmann fold flavoprotein
VVPEGPWDVVVVGAGPAGLLAAGRAAMLGARALLLEKMEKPARKLRITGKGRANITNMKPLEECLKEIHPEPRFLRQAFGAFFNRDLVALLAEAGVPTKVERGERVFPASDRAWDVAEALAEWARRQGAVLVRHARVDGLVIEDGAFRGVEVARARIAAGSVVLATGGQSYPGTGSTGDGYRFALGAGHRIEPLRPSLVDIETRPDWAAAAGLGLRNVSLELWIDGRRRETEFGEVLVTAKGFDGPAVLRLSRAIVDALAAGRKVEVSLDLKPALTAEQLEARLLRELEQRRGEPCGSLLRAFLPPPLVAPFARQLGVDPAAPLARLQPQARRKLPGLLKAQRFAVTGHGGWDKAIVTAGGVSLKEVDPRTLASRKIGNLYFAGEVLDLDGNTGGFNLQIAFSTGWLAGESAARQACSACAEPAVLSPG